MKVNCLLFALFIIGLSCESSLEKELITAAGRPAQLDVRQAGAASVRITLRPLDFKGEFPFTPSLAEKNYTKPEISLREVGKSITKRVGNLNIEVSAYPLTIKVKNSKGESLQNLVFTGEDTLSFVVGKSPILGLGEGGPLPENQEHWKGLEPEFDRRGRFHHMQPRWQRDAYGSRNPVPMLIGTEGWGLFVAAPWVEIDLKHQDRGYFIPWRPPATDSIQQTHDNQRLWLGKGKPPVDQIVPGLYDIFVFDTNDPSQFMKDVSEITGPAILPPKWALGYMQSHRTLEDDTQLVRIVDTFREKKIPVDAVIYLGTGFCPQGWNTFQPSFNFNPEVFKREPQSVLSDLHDRNVKTIVHMVPWDRDKLPTVQGSIPAQDDEFLNESHIQNYWQQHVNLMDQGIDAFWPDEGDWFNLFERIKRHQMYYQGPISTNPNVRPWSLHRNGHLGIAQWGGWVWSGDTESSWKTLETQISVGINHSLSLSPFWGSDIGGFYPNPEYTGELFARWFQFAAFCPSFRSHGRTWWTHLPWGWGLDDMGPRETNGQNDNSDPVLSAERNPLFSELNNPAIEPVVRKAIELRYQLLPYTYTLTWQARVTGMPLMRALWLHYPGDKIAREIGDEYLWGEDLLIAPVYEKGATSREVYLPDGKWYDWWNHELIQGGKTLNREVDLSTIPIYVKAGAIIPFDPIRQYTDQLVEEPTTMKVFRGGDGSFTMYEDDGISLEYLNGQGIWTNFVWNDESENLIIQPQPPEGGTNLPVDRIFKIELLPDGIIKQVKYSGRKVEQNFEK